MRFLPCFHYRYKHLLFTFRFWLVLGLASGVALAALPQTPSGQAPTAGVHSAKAGSFYTKLALHHPDRPTPVLNSWEQWFAGQPLGPKVIVAERSEKSLALRYQKPLILTVNGQTLNGWLTWQASLDWAGNGFVRFFKGDHPRHLHLHLHSFAFVYQPYARGEQVTLPLDRTGGELRRQLTHESRQVAHRLLGQYSAFHEGILARGGYQATGPPLATRRE